MCVFYSKKDGSPDIPPFSDAFSHRYCRTLFVALLSVFYVTPLAFLVQESKTLLLGLKGFQNFLYLSRSQFLSMSLLERFTRGGRAEGRKPWLREPRREHGQARACGPPLARSRRSVSGALPRSGLDRCLQGGSEGRRLLTLPDFRQRPRPSHP